MSIKNESKLAFELSVDKTNRANCRQEKVLEEIYFRTIRNFLDVFLLSEVELEGTLSGFDAIAKIREKYCTVVSPGTIYSVLYSMERTGLIEGNFDDRKRIYKLSKKGKQRIALNNKIAMELRILLINIQSMKSNFSLDHSELKDN